MKFGKFIKFGSFSKRIILLSLQIACLFSILALAILSHSEHLYQIQFSTFVMQDAIVFIGTGFLLAVILEQFTK